MRRPVAVSPRILCFIVVTLWLQSCQDASRFTEPDAAKVKPGRTLTVTGAGTGHGVVSAPQVGETILVCEIDDGGYSPTDCTKMYGWKSTVVLTAAADPLSTFAGWSGACTGTDPTCRVVMTQSRTVRATFNGQGPASFSLNVVGGGNGSGLVQSAAGPTPQINCSITTGSAGSGTCSATYQDQTQITLTVAPNSGHTFDGWTGDCSGTGNCVLGITADRSVTATLSAPPGPEATVGSWDTPITTPNGLIGLHLSFVGGRLLMWGHTDEPHTWNPVGSGFTRLPASTCTNPTNCELFCSGHAFLPNGKLLVAGGHNESLGDGNGLRQTSLFNGTSWEATTAQLNYARWYPTLVTLDNGDVLALGGTDNGTVGTVVFPERFNGSGWAVLSGASRSLSLYPRAFVEPKNGWVFYAGEDGSSYLNPNGSGSWSTVGLGAGGAKVVPNHSYGSAVMLNSRVLYIGGGGSSCTSTTSPLPENRTEIIDLADPTPQWSSGPPMAIRRRQTNATILPDGKVLVTGGTSQCGFNSESGAVFAAEAWDSATGWATWSTASKLRVYHSTAALLPDGRVMVIGSGDGGAPTQQTNYEIFSPPYLFKGARPAYTLPGGANDMHYNVPFTVQTADAASIRKVNIIRHTSTTHAFNMGQRLNTLTFTVTSGGLTLTPPASGRIAPPGPYLLFLINDKGVPSVAQTILLTQ